MPKLAACTKKMSMSIWKSYAAATIRYTDAKWHLDSRQWAKRRRLIKIFHGTSWGISSFFHAGDPGVLTSCMPCMWSLTGYLNGGPQLQQASMVLCLIVQWATSQICSSLLTRKKTAEKQSHVFLEVSGFVGVTSHLGSALFYKEDLSDILCSAMSFRGARPRNEPRAGAYIFLDRCANKWATGPKLSKPKGLVCSNYNCGRAKPYLPCLPYLTADSSRFSYMVRGWDLYGGAA